VTHRHLALNKHVAKLMHSAVLSGMRPVGINAARAREHAPPAGCAAEGCAVCTAVGFAGVLGQLAEVADGCAGVDCGGLGLKLQVCVEG
jgi:hypothetical protein